MQQIKSILIGWEETSRLCLSFNKVSWGSICKSCFHLWMRVDHEARSCSEPMNIAQQCMTFRQARQGCDLIRCKGCLDFQSLGEALDLTMVFQYCLNLQNQASFFRDDVDVSLDRELDQLKMSQVDLTEHFWIFVVWKIPCLPSHTFLTWFLILESLGTNKPSSSGTTQAFDEM